jgi:hypothetical protein
VSLVLLLRRLDRYWFEPAPARRPAVLRVLVGAYTLYYVGRRYRMFLKVAASDEELFRPVGVAPGLKKPVPVAFFRAVLVATLLANVAFTLGLRHRYTGPLFAGLLLWYVLAGSQWFQPWYVLWLLALFVLRPQRTSFAWLTAWSLAAQASYLLQYIVFPRLEIKGQTLAAQAWYVVAIYGLPLLVWAWSMWQRQHGERGSLVQADTAY